MNKSLILVNRVLAVLTLIGVVLVIYVLWSRPYQLRWGATDEDIQRPMPGDELDRNPTFLATRAITINGTPEQIWPWLIQMGYERAGFYGYDMIENLGSQRGPDSAKRIIPELQNVKVGDEIPISAAGSWVLYAIQPEDYFIWSGKTGDGGFTWALYPIDEYHTRLVSRIRWSHHWSPPSQLALDLFTEFTDHLAVRKILQGVKGRVEGQIESTAKTNTEFVFYVIAALIFFVTTVMLIVYPLSWKRWLAGLAAGVGWLITWYAPIPLWVGVLLELLILWNMRHAFRKLPGQRYLLTNCK